jgi:carbon storage regulator CsrA
MLVLTRKVQERILIGNDVKVIVCQIRPGSVMLGVDAPREIEILRGELVQSPATTDAGPPATLDELIAIGTARGYVRQADLESIVRLGGVTWQQAVKMVREVGLLIVPAEVSY